MIASAALTGPAPRYVSRGGEKLAAALDRFDDIVATNLAMRDMFDAYLSEDFKDVHVLFLHVHAGQALQMTDKAVRHPTDLAGLKLRVPGPTGNAVVEALGATPVTTVRPLASG